VPAVKYCLSVLTYTPKEEYAKSKDPYVDPKEPCLYSKSACGIYIFINAIYIHPYIDARDTPNEASAQSKEHCIH